MKKLILTLVMCFAVSSIAMAAPMTDLQKGESAAGYLYWNPKVDIDSYDIGNSNANGFYAETALTDKVIVGIETMKGDRTKNISGTKVSIDTRFTDFTVQYKIDNNVRLIAGNRNYDTSASVAGYGSASESTNKFIYGIGASTPLGDKTTAYATYLHDSYADDWQIGVNQTLSKNVLLNVNYRYHDEDYVTLKGIGAGLIYKF
ncbi:porin family protein [Sporomusa sp. KB1]|jgi:opacity protein-like surface antigen|uniref:porin family protein n=1 Tax=Sporomusa sp. KB1 TaxID=943346 RepID=UPI0011A402A0|nr:porin family protein [Sporomusa sp. KB1]TWH46575.1 hypothetical protein Salpa_2569 [Sporomusa sp. KB1]